MKREDKKPEYILCPRCELNYITAKEKLCPVCKAERGMFDTSILIPDEEEVERVCPICKINFLAEDEEICFVCAKERGDDGHDEVFLGDVEEEDDDKELVVDELEISLEHAAEKEDEDQSDLFIGDDDLDFEDESDDFELDFVNDDDDDSYYADDDEDELLDDDDL